MHEFEESVSAKLGMPGSSSGAAAGSSARLEDTDWDAEWVRAYMKSEEERWRSEEEQEYYEDAAHRVGVCVCVGRGGEGCLLCTPCPCWDRDGS